MGYLLPSYKKAIFDDIANNISSGSSSYYAFASNPVEQSGVPPITKDNYSSMFEYTWNMIFGKKITVNDIMPIIKKNIWVENKIFDRFDDKDPTIYEKDNYYTITEPLTVGGEYHVYLCIDNNNGSPSTRSPNSSEIPSQQFSQVYNFQTLPDKYVWRYLTSISSEIYNKFATNDYAPIYANTNVVTTASISSGVDVVDVINGGAGYTAVTNGTVEGYLNNVTIKIANTTPGENEFYSNSAIYFYNPSSTITQSQLKNIKFYEANTSGKWVVLDSTDPVTLSLIQAGVTKYEIAPKVVFKTDSTVKPKARSIVNTNTNSISEVIIYDGGANLTWAEATVEAKVGSGAVLKTIVSPPGGHGRDPAVELNMKGFCVSFKFSNTENGVILGNGTRYNKIGLLKNPYKTNGSLQKGLRYTDPAFSTALEATVSHTFNLGEIITGTTSGARGIVAFANSSYVYIVGDKTFAAGEFVSNTTSSDIAVLNTIVSRSDIYTKDLMPIYVQNINNVNRELNQTESFKLIIKL